MTDVAGLFLELPLVKVLVAVLALLVGYGLVLALHMALGAFPLQVLAVELVAGVRWGAMVEGVLLPIRCRVARVADLGLELALVLVLVAVLALLVGYGLVLALHVALGALDLRVLAVELIACVRGVSVVEGVLYPAGGGVARLALLILELPLVGILVAVLALLVGYGLVLALHMALGALHLLVLAVELVAGVRGGAVVEGVLLPILGRVARVADLGLELALVLVLVAVLALLELDRLVLAASHGIRRTLRPCA